MLAEKVVAVFLNINDSNINLELHDSIIQNRYIVDETVHYKN